MYYYGGYQGGYGYGGYPNYCCNSYPNYGYQGGYGFGAAIIIVLFILLVIVIGCRHNV